MWGLDKLFDVCLCSDYVSFVLRWRSKVSCHLSTLKMHVDRYSVSEDSFGSDSLEWPNWKETDSQSSLNGQITITSKKYLDEK